MQDTTTVHESEAADMIEQKDVQYTNVPGLRYYERCQTLSSEEHRIMWDRALTVLEDSYGKVYAVSMRLYVKGERQRVVACFRTPKNKTRFLDLRIYPVGKGIRIDLRESQVVIQADYEQGWEHRSIK